MQQAEGGGGGGGRPSEKPAHRKDRGITIMSASRNQLLFQILLLLVSFRHIKTKTPGPTPAPLVPTSHLPIITRSAVLKGESHTEKVELLNPVKLELECTWAGGQSVQPEITGYWSKDGSQIENSRFTVQLENEQYNVKRMFDILTEENLGNYSCVFKNEAKIDFILAAPRIGDVRDKPIVSYMGDDVVIPCKMEETKPKPTSWNWYKYNGTDKEQILTAAEPHRYKIENTDWKTKLVVHNLTEADSGFYYCGAVYAIGTTLSHVELKVITFWEPLKPFIAILIEVIVLVSVILLYERSRSKKNRETENGPNANQSNTPMQEENNEQEGSSVRQRKV